MKESFKKLFCELKCIYIHVPKTAGISLQWGLFGQVGLGHQGLREVQQSFSRSEYDQFLKFAFVRNPWSRTFSAFHYLKAGGRNSQDRQWAADNLVAFDEFNEFVCEWLTNARAETAIHFKPQIDFICDGSGMIGVDFVGHFEYLQLGLRKVCDELQLSALPFAFTHHNASRAHAKDYRQFYSREAREIVAQVYAEDIARWRYSFDNILPRMSSFL